MKRVAVITNGNYFARLILSRVISDPDIQVSAVVVVSGDYKKRTGFRALIGVGAVTTIPYTIYKVLVNVAFLLASRITSGAFTVADLAKRHGVPLYVSRDANAPEVKQFLAESRPDVLVSVSCPQRIKEGLLGVAPRGSINIHSSLLPAYAGLAPYFWVLSRGEAMTGTTVHYMVQRFDEGNILVQKTLPVERGISAFGLFRQLSLLGAEVLPIAIGMAYNLDTGVQQKPQAHSYFSHPDWRSYRNLTRHGHCLIRVSEIIATIRGEIQDAV